MSIRWFKEICGVNNENFSIAIHIYPDIDMEKTLLFWSNITGIPQTQFGKTQIDTRTDKTDKKKRKLPYGTAHITIKSCGNKSFGVLLHRKIIGWIEEEFRQVRV